MPWKHWIDLARYGMATLLAISLPSIAALLAIVVVEEKELRERFGQAYADYAARVPRFIPKSL